MATYLQDSGYATFYGGKYLNQVVYGAMQMLVEGERKRWSARQVQSELLNSFSTADKVTNQVSLLPFEIVTAFAGWLGQIE